MNESLQTEIFFKQESAEIRSAEVALLESVLPELIKAMMQVEKQQENE